eukprot:GHVU01018124.1.p2 GENE.GHVU01018124.1~~GHVU01018124.1.p2  ORF type:complete len:164 (-),score=27.77 GHVU01018124.1:671-1162(-)
MQNYRDAAALAAASGDETVQTWIQWYMGMMEIYKNREHGIAKAHEKLLAHCQGAPVSHEDGRSMTGQDLLYHGVIDKNNGHYCPLFHDAAHDKYYKVYVEYQGRDVPSLDIHPVSQGDPWAQLLGHAGASTGEAAAAAVNTRLREQAAAEDPPRPQNFPCATQ